MTRRADLVQFGISNMFYNIRFSPTLNNIFKGK